MKNKALKWFSMALIVQVGLIHLYQAPGEFGFSRFLGVVYAIIFIAALISALRILADEAWGWTLGAMVAVGSAALFAWSIAAGSSGAAQDNLLDPLGMIALVVDIAFMLLFVLHMAGSRGAVLSPPALAARGGAFIPAAAFLMLILVSLAAYQIDATLNMSKINQRTTPITQENLANEYGISVSQAAISAMDSIIDMRLRIFDANKAGNLLGDPYRQPYLLVEDNPGQVIYAARMGHHAHIIQTGGIYMIFFPNPQSALKPGARVSLVFGDIRLDSVVLK